MDDISVPSIFDGADPEPSVSREAWSNCWYCIFGPQSKDDLPDLKLGGRTCVACLGSTSPINFINLFKEDGTRKRRIRWS